jgi:OOP family OmpA-OmpF porin
VKGLLVALAVEVRNCGGNMSTCPLVAILAIAACTACSNARGGASFPLISGRTADRDGDGIVDSKDKCLDDPEDYDGFQDEDGCPDPDNDNDGVLDVNDECPNVPGPASHRGCPVVPDADRDGDGIPDMKDKCPGVPEDRDGFEDTDGCPDTDNDHDGVLDKDDQCPNDPGPASAQGCPVR